MALSENCKTIILLAITGKREYANIAPTCFIGLLKNITASGDTVSFVEPEASAGYGLWERRKTERLQTHKSYIFQKQPQIGELLPILHYSTPQQVEHRFYGAH